MGRMLALGAVCTLLFAACGGEEQASSKGGGGKSQGEKAASVTIEIASSDFGDILVDPEGMTLYMFVPDQKKNGKPTCYGSAPMLGRLTRPPTSSPLETVSTNPCSAASSERTDRLRSLTPISLCTTSRGMRRPAIPTARVLATFGG